MIKAQDEISVLKKELSLIAPERLRAIEPDHVIIPILQGSQLNKASAIMAVSESINQNFKLPSSASMRDMIFKQLEAATEPIKAASIIDSYFPNVFKEIRKTIQKRFSLTLNSLKTEGEIFSKNVKGEKGDLYTIHKEWI